ncbi:MAG: hypothetical protein J0L99_20140 [Chitinophagales bacterium]|nr:hypothetical protein [Chitinophagales bacterium]
MKKILFPAITLALLAATVLPTACYYDNETDLYGGTATCDTVNQRYSVEVQQIMAANCLSCHNGPGGAAAIPMETHALLKEFATNGTLIDRINDSGSPMPPSGLMSACDRSKMEAWVKAGAPNN